MPMADSLFDNRYRYDYIYPRGRSGETLRAVDTQDHERPVVIKRPAPNDAPPIRAGQEVSILNERKALQKLAGHPVATALVGGGQFFVGGMAHQYIVMERGQGAILADLVRELGQRGERLPELELLVIIDGLLDLLQAAHHFDIVYNDVDSKHIFWDRDAYRLKVIDWGNAVFLEGDEMTPQGVSRQTDVYQMGELLYYLVRGGERPSIPRDAGEDFALDFGEDAERLSPRLMAIISKAAHPNPKFRYKSIPDLRKALTDYRDPYERERNAVIGRVSDRLKQQRSKDELSSLLDALTPILAADPGHPAARSALGEVQARLRDLEVEADLDASRIYLESASWSRAVSLLEELRDRARHDTRSLIEMLLDCAHLMQESGLQPAPPAVQDAIGLVFERENIPAANLLVTALPNDNKARTVQWLLAERISAHAPEVLLLRPNLFRLETAFIALAQEGVGVAELRAVLAEIQNVLNSLSSVSTVNIIELRDGYRSVVDGLTAMGTLVEAINRQHQLPDSRLPISALERSMNAAMALADNMHVIGRQATSSPRDALNALDSSRAIDPTNPIWEQVRRMLDGMYELLGSYQTYVPAADGSDLAAWLQTTRMDLLPFQERLFDEMLVNMVNGLQVAAQSWEIYGEATISGNRYGCITALTSAIDSVTTISPTLAGWLNQVRTIITNAQYIERHALFGGLGRALADGWEAFDRGRLADAERLGQQAVEIARSEGQRAAASRLRRLSGLTRDWMERNGINNAKGTQVAMASVEDLYTADENATRENFTRQMPSKETYLKAMQKGLVELYSRNSTAAPHILFVNYVMLGVLDAHESRLEDAEFWHEASTRVLGEFSLRHPLARLLADFIERRRDLNTAAMLFNTVTHSAVLPTLEATRKRLEDNPQAKLLGPGILSLRELEASTRDWSDGEFRSAGIKIENAMNGVSEVEQAAGITLTQYRAWLMELQAGAAELHNQMRQINSLIEGRPDKPVEGLKAGHRRLVDVTQKMIGEPYIATLKGWRDTYEQFLAVYTDHTIRRSEKLSRFNQLFRAMFIDRHPAYPLYRHWYDLTDAAPEFPAPPTSEPTPRITDEADSRPINERIAEYQRTGYDDEEEEAAPRRKLPLPLPALLGIGALLIVGIIALVVSNQSGTPVVQLTITSTATVDSSATAAAIAAASASDTPVQPTRTPITPTTAAPTALPLVEATSTLLPSVTSLPSLPPPPLASETPTVTPLPSLTQTPSITPTPTLTQTPSITPTPSNTFTPTPSFTPTLPPQGLQGEQDVLALLDRLTTTPWSADQFSKVQAIESTYWRLGSSEASDEPIIAIELPVDLLETFYGANAASRIRRLEVEMALQTFNPSQVGIDQVFFGALLRDAANPAQQAGMNIGLVQNGVLNIGQRSGSEVNALSNRPIGVYVARIRLERDPATGDITTFFNGEQIGQPLRLSAGDAPVLPVVYVKNGGVIVSITRWSVTLR